MIQVEKRRQRIKELVFQTRKFGVWLGIYTCFTLADPLKFPEIFHSVTLMDLGPWLNFCIMYTKNISRNVSLMTKLVHYFICDNTRRRDSINIFFSRRIIRHALLLIWTILRYACVLPTFIFEYYNFGETYFTSNAKKDHFHTYIFQLFKISWREFFRKFLSII